MEIKTDNLTDKRTIELISGHLAGMAENSPAESIHALNVEGLKRHDVTFYSAPEEWGTLYLPPHCRGDDLL